jgi:acyl-coenzyme A synthetase/AMP-(fatty) acid ligase
VTEKELLEFFNNQVPNFKMIRGGIIFRNEIPRNPIGKLLRRNMRDWAERQAVTN